MELLVARVIPDCVCAQIIGLSSIPFIVTPIDEGVHHVRCAPLMRPRAAVLTSPFSSHYLSTH
eukprot:2294123-Rhodomonas_salina.1